MITPNSTSLNLIELGLVNQMLYPNNRSKESIIELVTLFKKHGNKFKLINKKISTFSAKECKKFYKDNIEVLKLIIHPDRIKKYVRFRHPLYSSSASTIAQSRISPEIPNAGQEVASVPSFNTFNAELLGFFIHHPDLFDFPSHQFQASSVPPAANPSSSQFTPIPPPPYAFHTESIPQPIPPPAFNDESLLIPPQEPQYVFYNQLQYNTQDSTILPQINSDEVITEVTIQATDNVEKEEVIDYTKNKFTQTIKEISTRENISFEFATAIVFCFAFYCFDSILIFKKLEKTNLEELKSKYIRPRGIVNFYDRNKDIIKPLLPKKIIKYAGIREERVEPLRKYFKQLLETSDPYCPKFMKIPEINYLVSNIYLIKRGDIQTITNFLDFFEIPFKQNDIKTLREGIVKAGLPF